MDKAKVSVSKLFLKPCPFCGSREIYAGVESASAFHVMCLDCGARSRPVDLSTPMPEGRAFVDMASFTKYLIEIAAEAWNRRPEDRTPNYRGSQWIKQVCELKVGPDVPNEKAKDIFLSWIESAPYQAGDKIPRGDEATETSVVEWLLSSMIFQEDATNQWYRTKLLKFQERAKSITSASYDDAIQQCIINQQT